MKKLFTLLLLVATVLAGCDDPAMQGAGGPGFSLATPRPLKLEDAEGVAAGFLQAWAEDDYERMYSFLSPLSQDAYPLEAFTAAYEEAENTMTMNGFAFKLTSSLQQGTTAAISYDATFKTVVLGEFQDTDRIMRLVATPEDWRVAWSRMDIFNELSGGSYLVLNPKTLTRANIYDRSGKILADQNGIAVTINVITGSIPNETECLTLLANLLDRPFEELRLKLDNTANDRYVTLGEIDVDTYERQQENLGQTCNAQFDNRPTRRYYGGGTAPHVVGYVGAIQENQVSYYQSMGYPADALVGQDGIEAYYERTLAGKPGGELLIYSPTNDLLRRVAERAAEPSQSIYLTIDRDLQIATEQALESAYRSATANFAASSPGAAAVVMDVNTGEILALASYPSFDPNIFDPTSPLLEEVIALNSDPRQPLYNRVTLGELAVGSVFKIVSMAAVADAGIYEYDHVSTCNGEWNGIPGNPLPCWYVEGHGSITLPRGLTYSCDPYFYQVGKDIYENDPEVLAQYAIQYGFGSETGLRELVEGDGNIDTPTSYRQTQGQEWNMAQSVFMAIGQGTVTVTPLQVARLMVAMATDGQMLRPQLIRRIGILGEPPSWEFEGPDVQSVVPLNEGLYDLIQEALCDVTKLEGGTAQWYYRDMEVHVCGKTGTAQTGGPIDPPNAWFSAYAPAVDPEIAIVVVVQNGGEGSRTASPIVRRIVESYYDLEYMEWPEEWEYPNAYQQVPEEE
jgi:penicillin-binding protein 2